jgi:two-component system nitrogen regulation response regulator NtrX
MSLKAQAKVLRTLQENRVEPIGGGGALDTDVRVIAATNKDLTEEIKAGRFREDLYFRLAVVPLQIPPLRERKDELIPLAEAFIARIAKGYGKPIKHLSSEAKEALLCHDWPGNVRELKNMMERVVILARGAEITADDLGAFAVGHAAGSASMAFPEFSSLREAREWFEGMYIQQELKLQVGNVTRAAERLGLDRSSLYKRMKALGVEQKES